MKKATRLFISGTVQGIFFRKFIEEKARQLKLNGLVRNLEDGSVEIIIEGQDNPIMEMIDITKKGSLHSKIEHIEYREIKHQGFDNFKVLNF